MHVWPLFFRLGGCDLISNNDSIRHFRLQNYFFQPTKIVWSKLPNKQDGTAPDECVKLHRRLLVSYCREGPSHGGRKVWYCFVVTGVGGINLEVAKVQSGKQVITDVDGINRTGHVRIHS